MLDTTRVDSIGVELTIIWYRSRRVVVRMSATEHQGQSATENQPLMAPRTYGEGMPAPMVSPLPLRCAWACIRPWGQAAPLQLLCTDWS